MPVVHRKLWTTGASSATLAHRYIEMDRHFTNSPVDASPAPGPSPTVGGPGALPGEGDALLWTVLTQRVLSLLTRKWVVSIVRVLHDEPKRPFQMKIEIKGIQPKVLRQTLRALEADGLVDQILMSDGLGGRCIAWQLTERGRSLVTPMAALYRWGRDNLPVGGVQAAIDG